jgi:hypothetical protein
MLQLLVSLSEQDVHADSLYQLWLNTEACHSHAQQHPTCADCVVTLT